jgi:hypothetical protein
VIRCGAIESRLDHRTEPKIAIDCLGDGHHRDGVVVWIGIN